MICKETIIVYFESLKAPKYDAPYYEEQALIVDINDLFHRLVYRAVPLFYVGR